MAGRETLMVEGETRGGKGKPREEGNGSSTKGRMRRINGERGKGMER